MLPDSQGTDAAAVAEPEASPALTERFNSLSLRYWTGPFDLRPVAFFRIVFGIATLTAVLDLGPVLFDLLSDEGVMPRAALLSGLARVNRFSVFDFAGPYWVTVALWLLTVLALSAFIVGFRTRIASVCAFVLVTGLHERNLQVFDGADNVIRVMLFWAMLMDAGGRYSVDALLRARAGLPRRSFGWGLPVRLAQLQFAWIYLDSVFWKLQGKYWLAGKALRFALGLDHLFTRSIGARLFNAAWFIIPGSYYTLLVEATFLFLVFAPFWQPRLRALALLSGGALHGGIWILMNVGNFAYVMPATYSLFVEPEWADFMLAFARRSVGQTLGPVRVAWLRAAGTWALDWIADPVETQPRFTTFWALTRQLASPFLVLLLAAGLWFSVPPSMARPMPDWLHQTVQELEIWQSWDMFAPDPMNTDSWLKGVGQLSDGVEVDVLRGNDGGPLPSIYPHFYFSRWTKFENGIAYGDQGTLLQFGRYLCRQWNTRPPKGRKALKTFKIYREERRTPELGAEPPAWGEVLIWEHQCF